jgi:hypothetical protein
MGNHGRELEALGRPRDNRSSHTGSQRLVQAMRIHGSGRNGYQHLGTLLPSLLLAVLSSLIGFQGGGG